MDIYANDTVPDGTNITYKILKASDNSTLCTISSNQANSGYDISFLTAKSIRLYAELTTTNTLYTPSLHDWKVSWTEDIIPPSSITNLHSTSGESWINWTWNNPSDSDFNHSMVYLDGVFQTNTSAEYYNATGLTEGTKYTITLQTVDTNGNINSTEVIDSAKTKVKQELYKGWNFRTLDIHDTKIRDPLL
ncbi:MAG: hypothetical protein ACE5J3_04730 [Methanosarcinales archaeon]